MATLAQRTDEYLAGIGVVRQAVAGMNREQLTARPVAGKWSTLEVVCHLADFEPIMADRIKRVIALENPALIGADENCFARTLAYHERDLDEELAIVEHTRRQLARILRKQPNDILTRIGTHNERGPRTLEQLLEGAINHVTHHIKFVHEKRKALGLA
jgi:uncharacterized damage-inducible protein DinB